MKEVTKKSTTLLDCPICGSPTTLEQGKDGSTYRYCSTECTAPRCCHPYPDQTILAWNDFARWYCEKEGKKSNK